jgi:MFS family permease
MPLRRAALAPALVIVGLMAAVVSSLGAPLIPVIAERYGAELSTAQWSLTVTMLVGAVAAPILGRLGDGPHRRPVLLGALGVVVAGGVLAALASSLGVLIAGRALQGFGLALLPLAMAVARDHVEERLRARTIAALSLSAAIGIGLGYPITGLIAEFGTISTAYWFGAGASGIALALAIWTVPAAPADRAPTSLDQVGTALVSLGLLALLVGVERGPDWGWADGRTLGLLAAAAALLAAWSQQALRTAAPLVELRLLRHRAVLTANGTSLVLGMAMYLLLSLMTQYVQLDRGLAETAFVAGLTLVPVSVMSAVASRVAPALERRFGARATIPIGSVVIAIGATFFGLTGDHLWQAMVTMGLVGLGLGCTFVAMPGLIVPAVPASETSSALSFYQVVRYVGFSIGSGLAVTFLRIFGGDGPGDPTAYHRTFLVAALLGLVAAALAWILPGRPTGEPRPRPRDLELREREEGLLGAAGLEADGLPSPATR